MDVCDHYELSLAGDLCTMMQYQRALVNRNIASVIVNIGDMAIGTMNSYVSEL